MTYSLLKIIIKIFRNIFGVKKNLLKANAWLLDTSLSKDSEDGIQIAGDILVLDLSKNELVVLSACQTGLGEVLAGAQTLVMSLWNIVDEQTKESKMH